MGHRFIHGYVQFGIDYGDCVDVCEIIAQRQRNCGFALTRVGLLNDAKGYCGD